MTNLTFTSVCYGWHHVQSVSKQNETMKYNVCFNFTILVSVMVMVNIIHV